MKVKYFIGIASLSFLIFILSCDNSDTVDQAIEIEDFAISNILPSNPQTGDKLKIVLNKQLSDNTFDGFVYFNNNWPYSDSVKKDTIFTFLPFIKNNSTVEVKINIYEEDNLNEVTKSILINRTCEQQFCVIKNDEGEVFYQDIYPRGVLGEIPEWQITKNKDTTTLSAFMTIADESNQTIRLKFLDTDSEGLPIFLNYVRIKNESNGASPYVTTIDTLQTGLIKIESWDNNGTYSGKIYAELEPFESRTYFPPRTVFWINTQ